MDTTLIPVCVGACLCPGTPHADGDFVYLRPKLGLASGIAIQKLIIDSRRRKGGLAGADLMGTLAEGYLIYGVADWDFTNDSGKIPVTPDTIRSQLLDDFARSAEVADAADDLYMGVVIAPLAKQALKSLPTTPSNGSTSAPGNGARKPRKRSKPSSTSTSRTGATATTS